MARRTKEKDRLDEVIDQLDLKGITRDELLGQGGLIKQLTGKILQRALEALGRVHTKKSIQIMAK
jgi:hypothetical protein